MTTVGMISRGGRAESVPGLDSVETYTEEWVHKRVRFHGKIGIVHIPLWGKGRKIDRGKDSRWHKEFVPRSDERFGSQGSAPRGSTIGGREERQHEKGDAAK